MNRTLPSLGVVEEEVASATVTCERSCLLSFLLTTELRGAVFNNGGCVVQPIFPPNPTGIESLVFTLK